MKSKVSLHVDDIVYKNTNKIVFIKNLKIKYTIIISSHGLDRQSRHLIVFSRNFEYGFRCASHGSRPPESET